MFQAGNMATGVENKHKGRGKKGRRKEGNEGRLTSHYSLSGIKELE